MSRASMTAAAARLPRAPLYGIARCRVGSDFLDFDIGWDEIERDTDWAHSIMRSAGLRPGDLMLITASSWEGPWIGPVVHALRRIGVTYLTAEVFDWDARRSAMFLQRLPVRAVFGLGGQTLTGLDAQGFPIAELFGGVEMVWARPDALHRLPEVSAPLLPFVELGPALGLGVPGRSGVLVNAAEWTVDSDDNQLLVSNTRVRATRFDHVPTGVRATVRSSDDHTVTLDLAR